MILVNIAQKICKYPTKIASFYIIDKKSIVKYNKVFLVFLAEINNTVFS